MAAVSAPVATVVPAKVYLPDFPADYTVTIKAAPTVELPDGFLINLAEVRKSVTIANMLEDMGSTVEEIPVDSPDEHGVNTIDNNTLANVFTYIRMLAENPLPAKKETGDALRVDEQEWEKTFFGKLEVSDHPKKAIFNFILAANNLDIKEALQAAALHIANGIKGKTPDEIRATFSVATKVQ